MTPRYLQGSSDTCMDLARLAAGIHRQPFHCATNHMAEADPYRCHRSCGLSDRARILEKLPVEKERGLPPSSKPRGRAWPQLASLPTCAA